MTESSPLTWTDFPGAPKPGDVVAPFDSIPNDGALLVTLSLTSHPYKIILLRSGETVLGYLNRCAHFGVPLASKVEHLYIKPNESLACSVHSARYRWTDGLCIRGDCEGEYLLKIPVMVKGTDVLIADDTALAHIDS